MKPSAIQILDPDATNAQVRGILTSALTDSVFSMVASAIMPGIKKVLNTDALDHIFVM